MNQRDEACLLPSHNEANPSHEPLSRPCCCSFPTTKPVFVPSEKRYSKGNHILLHTILPDTNRIHQDTPAMAPLSISRRTTRRTSTRTTSSFNITATAFVLALALLTTASTIRALDVEVSDYECDEDLYITADFSVTCDGASKCTMGESTATIEGNCTYGASSG